MRGMARSLAMIGLAASATVGAGGAPGIAADICAPRAISVLDAWAQEGGVLSFTVMTSGCTAGTVQYQTMAGTATAGADFVAASGQLSWAAGDTTGRTVSVATVDNLFVEPGEGLTLKLHTPAGLSISDGTAAGVIVDDDVEFDLLSEPFCVIETCVNCWLIAEASAPVPADVTVHFVTRNGTALGGNDFVATEGRVTIPRGETRARIGIRFIDDKIAEHDETFTVTILDVSAGRIGDATTTVTIVDDDRSGQAPSGPPGARHQRSH